MNIHIANPIAFCPGVKRVVNKTLEIIKDYPSANIYLIGSLVHNKLVNDQLAKFKNVKILKDKPNKSRLDLVKSIPDGSNVIIFSAHGTDPKAIDYAENKGWKVFDLTCPFVLKIMDKIKWAILHGYHVGYFGDKDHVEAIAAKQLGGNNLTIYKNKKDAKKLLGMSKVFITTQSTMNVDEFEDTVRWFNYPQDVKSANLICHSSRQRQADAKECKDYDAIFVLTDPESHNGIELYNELASNHTNVVMVNPNKISLNKNLLKRIKDCAVFSSSSVAQEQVDKFVNLLKKVK